MSFDNETADLLKRGDDDVVKTLYERHGVAVGFGAKALLDEIRLDGSNTFATVLRGYEGVPYQEVVDDVAVKLRAPLQATPQETEVAILEAVINKYLEKAKPEEREALQRVIEQAGSEATELVNAVRAGALAAGVLRAVLLRLGPKVAARLIANIFLRMATRAVAREAAKWVLIGVPIVNIAMFAWLAIDIAGPAYRKTIPTVIQVALLRLDSTAGSQAAAA